MVEETIQKRFEKEEKFENPIIRSEIRPIGRRSATWFHDFRWVDRYADIFLGSNAAATS
jgi:hypothetical protein